LHEYGGGLPNPMQRIVGAIGVHERHDSGGIWWMCLLFLK
jgi:hypothetical protein